MKRPDFTILLNLYDIKSEHKAKVVIAHLKHSLISVFCHCQLSSIQKRKVFGS